MDFFSNATTALSVNAWQAVFLLARVAEVINPNTIIPFSPVL